jgi:hypothetical protein
MRMRAALKHIATRLLRKAYSIFPWLDGPWIRDIQIGYEKSGIVVRGEPIPWNADAVLIEVQVWFPQRVSPKNEFALELSGEPPVMPVAQQPVLDTEEATVCFVFRMPVPARSCRVGLFWRCDFLAHIALKTLSREEFLANLHLESTTLFARLGDQNVACAAVVAGQVQALTAGVVLRSVTSLLPIVDLCPCLEVTGRSGETHALPLVLTSGQLTGREAMASVILPEWLHGDHGVHLQWSIAGQWRADSRLHPVTAESFRRSLVCVDCRYVMVDRDGVMASSRYFLVRDDVTQLGPCFLVASREPGIAAVHSFCVRIHYKDPDRRPDFVEQGVLITDGPSPFIPLMLSPEEFQRVASFDLFSDGEHLSQLALCTRDTATFTNEGGFTAPEDYPWTPTAEEELADHLRKLMDVPRPAG